MRGRTPTRCTRAGDGPCTRHSRGGRARAPGRSSSSCQRPARTSMRGRRPAARPFARRIGTSTPPRPTPCSRGCYRRARISSIRTAAPSRPTSKTRIFSCRYSPGPRRTSTGPHISSSWTTSWECTRRLHCGRQPTAASRAWCSCCWILVQTSTRAILDAA